MKVIAVRDLIPSVEGRIADGFLYGDCQYSTDIDAGSPDHPGVFSCYRPVADDRPLANDRKILSQDDWARLYVLARTDKKRAFAAYADHYLRTNGQIYWSDLHQVAGQFDVRNLQEALVRYAGASQRGSEMITEVYVRRENLLPFLPRHARTSSTTRSTSPTARFASSRKTTSRSWPGPGSNRPASCATCTSFTPTPGKRKPPPTCAG